MKYYPNIYKCKIYYGLNLINIFGRKTPRPEIALDPRQFQGSGYHS